MRKLKLDVGELQVESFDIARSGHTGTVRGLESEETFVGDTNCATCPPDSFGGSCQVLGCAASPNCSAVCTSWGCTDQQTCRTCDTYNCGYGCTQETCGYNCTIGYPCEM